MVSFYGVPLSSVQLVCLHFVIDYFEFREHHDSSVLYSHAAGAMGGAVCCFYLLGSDILPNWGLWWYWVKGYSLNTMYYDTVNAVSTRWQAL
jgi:hypothetical protein